MIVRRAETVQQNEPEAERRQKRSSPPPESFIPGKTEDRAGPTSAVLKLKPSKMRYVLF